MARLTGLKEIWRETLSLDPAWRDYSQARTVQELLDSSGEKLPRLSLAVLLGRALLPSRERAAACARIYDSLNRLPSKRLREEAISIVETAARYVVVAALKRSLFAWALAPLLAAVFIVYSVHWQLRIVVEGVPQASMNLAGIRLRRTVLGPGDVARHRLSSSTGPLVRDFLAPLFGRPVEQPSPEQRLQRRLSSRPRTRCRVPGTRAIRRGSAKPPFCSLSCWHE